METLKMGASLTLLSGRETRLGWDNVMGICVSLGWGGVDVRGFWGFLRNSMH